MIHIGGKEISNNSPVYFIAEIGSNFDGEIQRAKDLIWQAKECLADAVKFQHYTATTLVSDFEFTNLKNETHQKSWKRSVFETYSHAELNAEWTSELAAEARTAGIDFFTSPYAYHLADLVNDYVPAFKIGSGDISWLDFIEYVAKKGKPVLLATGASTMDEVDRALKRILSVNEQLVLMQCNTNYSGTATNYKYINLRVLRTYAERYPSVVLGLSDHSTSISSILGGIALGARVIERHFTDDVQRVGPDHPFSTDPKSWREMIRLSRELEDMLGDGVKRIEENELHARVVQRRSVCAAKKLPAGHILTEDDFDYLRPCQEDAYPPTEANTLIGTRLLSEMQKGESFRIQRP